MATGTCEEVGHAYGKLDKLVKAWGSPLRAPYMTLSFMALLVIPALKLSDRGYSTARSLSSRICCGKIKCRSTEITMNAIPFKVG